MKVPAIEAKNLGLRFDVRLPNVFESLSFEINSGEFVSIVGRSGVGKSSLLHVLGGFRLPTHGVVRCFGKDIVGPATERGIVFQEAALFESMTAKENIAACLTFQQKSIEEQQRAQVELLEATGLIEAKDKYPYELSGGMRQRVALARALAVRPQVLLLDEPFAGLDAFTRRDMQQLLANLRRSYEMTVLLVTHDIDEAIALSNRVIVLAGTPGKIVGECSIESTRSSGAFAESDARKIEVLRLLGG